MKIKNYLYILFPFVFLFTLELFAQETSKKDAKRLEIKAKNVTIIRDNWGIAHVYGKTDSDAVFGMLYAQCEDDFKRVELNYIDKLGRLSEVKGLPFLYNDLETRLLIDANEAKSDYKKASPCLKKLLNSFADGINYYLLKHPEVHPSLLTHFEPWFPLLWTDGSIGAISTADLTTAELKTFYSGNSDKVAFVEREKNVQTGSNGFAIAPSKSVSGNALLYINPHTTFYFRPEIQISSEEGLNTYGAVTWGQFFIYQGFNDYCGWMHTSSNTDVADLYAEKIISKNNRFYYEYDKKILPVKEKIIKLNYLENGEIKSKTIKTYFTLHGPIMAKRDGQWISLKSNNRSMNSLEQSWIRTKSKNFDDYKKAMDLKANASNNTVYADTKGNIAYWHGNFIPVRDSSFNWGKVVDGTTKKTEWKGLHSVSETVHIYNPMNGWLQNCNSTPFSVAGINSPKKEFYPAYMAPDGENFRGLNAVRLFNEDKKYSLDQLITLGYDSKLSIFEVLLPALFSKYEQQSNTNELIDLVEPISLLKNWDYYASENSVATTLANEWAYKLDPILQKVYIDEGEKDQIENTEEFAKKATPDQMLPQLLEVVNELKTKFGSWKIPWGDLNRYQRITGAINLDFDDASPSLPIGRASGLWGSLPAYKSAYQNNSKKRYGFNGNSFVCVVEFGAKIKAKSVLTGGNSGDPKSKHFNDQATMYQKGQFKEVYFYEEDVNKNAEKTYHPGE